MSCEVKIRKYIDFDVKYMAEIWNEVIRNCLPSGRMSDR